MWGSDAARELAGRVRAGADDVRRLAARAEGAAGVDWVSLAAEEFRHALIADAVAVRRAAAALDQAAAAIRRHAAATDQFWPFR
jgi:hypothetical protein